MNNWNKSPHVWRWDNIEYISVVFTWDLPKARKIYNQGSINIKKKYIGGPAIKMFPEYFNDLPGVILDNPPKGHEPLMGYNIDATITSVGCPNKCGFCAVSRIHPDFIEFDRWELKPIICDDNLLACSDRHFESVIHKLSIIDGMVDFNQGLDPSLLDPRKASLLAELKNPMIRLAWDDIKKESDIVNAVTNLRKAGIPRNNIRCYVLIGFNDTPDDALYRLNVLRYGLGIKPNPMRYQPTSGIHCLTKNSYVHPSWTSKELDRFMSYWANLRFTGGVPFQEYEHHKRGPK